jgi:hypothetical protein
MMPAIVAAVMLLDVVDRPSFRCLPEVKCGCRRGQDKQEDGGKNESHMSA